MKQLFIAILCCIALCPQNAYSYIYNEGKIFLQHNGQTIKTYNNKQLQTAINDAIPNDTIYLSNGYFDGMFTINKSIAIIGIGYDSETNIIESWVRGSFKVSTDSIERIHLEGFILKADFNDETYKKSEFCGCLDYDNDKQDILANIKHLELKNIMSSSMLILYGNISDVKIENCKIYNVKDHNYKNKYKYTVSNLTAHNSILGECSSGNPSACWNLSNCQVSLVCGGIIVMNSIIEKVNTLDSSIYSNCILVNSLYEKKYEETLKDVSQDCMVTDHPLESNVQNADCLLSKEQLKEFGYLGTDGTIVGPYGGNTPLTLLRDTPLIKEANITFPFSEYININISATAN